MKLSTQAKAALCAVAMMVPPLTGAVEAPAEAQGDAKQVFARVASSVVTVNGTDAAGLPEVQGSGVVVADGLVATNCHVVQEAAGLKVTAAEGDFAAEWTRQIPAYDLCLLRVPGLKARPVRIRAADGLRVGEPVFAIGNPLGFGLAVSAGLVAMVQKPQEKGYPMVVATAPQSPGSSGGGLFDAEGRLVGLTTAILGTGQTVNRVVSSDGIGDLLAAAPSGPSQPRTPPPLPLPKAVQWVGDAEALNAAGRWGELEAHGLAWSLAQPAAALPLWFVGAAQSALGRNAEAEATLRRSVALDGHLARAWLSLAQGLHAQGRTAEAERALATAESAAPFLDATARLRAQWLERQGKLADAVAQQREAVRRMPSASGLWTELGRLEDASGHPQEASRALASALRLGVADTAIQRRLAELKAGGVAGPTGPAAPLAAGDTPESAAQAAIGWSEFLAKRYGPAEQALRAAIAIAPKSGMAWNALGAVLTRTARLADAEDAFSKAHEAAPGDAGVLSNRAGVRLDLKRYELAEQDARAAVKLSPVLAPAWRALGRTLFATRKFREGAAAFAQIDEMNALTSDDRVTWAECLLALGSPDEAQKQLRAAEADALPSRGLNLAMAKALGARNDLAGALVYVNKAVEANPTDALAWSSKGYALIKLGRLPEAVEALETAVRLDPTVSNPWINLGEAQLQSRNLGRAIEALEKGLQLTPAAADGRLLLAQSYLGARLPVKTREHAEMLLARQPGFPPALVLVTLSYLMENNPTAASVPYLRLVATAPEVAKNLRARAVASGLSAAVSLPE
ncbi:MAG: hypothetical protein JWQ88_517 [Rhodoferax sp.]|nr:hypothetical protein [Rhodoferax sp.]